MNAVRLKARFDYGRGSGLKRVDLWGGEYWYYRLVKLQDPSLWNVAKQEFSANPKALKLNYTFSWLSWSSSMVDITTPNILLVWSL